MIQLTSKQKKILKKYENHLITAYKSDYIRGLSQSAAIELSDIYVELGFTKPNTSCGACKLKLCKDLGRIYFAQVPSTTTVITKTKNGLKIHEEPITTDEKPITVDENDGKDAEIDS